VAMPRSFERVVIFNSSFLSSFFSNYLSQFQTLLFSKREKHRCGTFIFPGYIHANTRRRLHFWVDRAVESTKFNKQLKFPTPDIPRGRSKEEIM
jgi:hypothetical protein